MKFVGFTLDNDRTTLAGLPQPIHEGVAILKKHMYRSLAEVQVEVRIFSSILFWIFAMLYVFLLQREDEIARYPVSKPEGEVEQVPAEVLYQAMVTRLDKNYLYLKQ